jgi:CheY-like chemotaxis protein
LTSILGYADLLTDPALPAKQRGQYLEVLQQNANHLLALIDDLLDLSRAEMGKVRLTFNDHSPRAIAEEAVELLRARAAEKALELTLNCAPDLPEVVHTDGVRVRQILLNLLSNAIKFTPWGRVSLGIASRAGRRNEPTIEFRVTDTGIGVAQEHLAKVFEPFYQIDQGARKRFGGSGLGLSISRQLALQMGGALRVESSPGKGSTFILELPVKASQKSPPIVQAPTVQPTLSGTILLAEDNPSVRLLVDEYLRRAGAAVLMVSDGAQALEMMRKSMSEGEGRPGHIDLALLDLHMPEMDGAEAMRKMRAAGFPGPIVGLTADYTERSAAEWVRDGWDAMAAKPIDRQAFIPLLARMLDSHRKQDVPAATRS